MVNREKVKQGLRCCALEGKDCASCPYDGSGRDCRQLDLDMLAILEEEDERQKLTLAVDFAKRQSNTV